MFIPIVSLIFIILFYALLFTVSGFNLLCLTKLLKLMLALLMFSHSFLTYRHDTWGHVSASLVAQMVKNLPVMQEIWVQTLGGEDTLEKGTATPSSILAW